MSAGTNPYELNPTTLNFVGQAAPSSAHRAPSSQGSAVQSSAQQASAQQASAQQASAQQASAQQASAQRIADALDESEVLAPASSSQLVSQAANSAESANSADELADAEKLEREQSDEAAVSGETTANEATVKLPEALQRVAEARQQQGFSLRTIARRTGIDLRTLRAHENPKTDMKLSELRAWQLALELPIVDLIEDDLQPLSSPVKDRAMLVKIMKTVVAIKEAGGPPRVQRLATMLFEQMVELMPELKEVGGWPQHGSRRTGNSRMVEQQVNTQSLGLERME